MKVVTLSSSGIGESRGDELFIQIFDVMILDQI